MEEFGSFLKLNWTGEEDFEENERPLNFIHTPHSIEYELTPGIFELKALFE